MRLLNVHTLEFEEFYHDNIDSVPPYIIASHRWGKHEPKYKDVLKRRRSDSAGYKKVEAFCRLIRESGIEVDWLWIDTVCIDKSSSAELHESINSMFKWYANAECCLALLGDVRTRGQLMNDDLLTSALKRSKWFTRGWTLQELIAPRVVVFLNQDWQVIGHKGSIQRPDPKAFGSVRDLTASISDITGIAEDVLQDCEKRKECSDEEKMSWMENRRTTRVEDLAYCLLGIFEVFMPLVYGEGDQSRERLLKEILLKKEAATSRAVDEGNEKRAREAEINWQLALEERALDLASTVSRLMRRGYDKDEAMFEIALKWQRDFGRPVEEAREEIAQYVSAIERHARWTRHQYRELRREGLTQATAIRRMEAVLCQDGYNPVEAYKSVRGRLFYKPLPKQLKQPSSDESGHLIVPTGKLARPASSQRHDSATAILPAIRVQDFAYSVESKANITCNIDSSLAQDLKNNQSAAELVTERITLAVEIDPDDHSVAAKLSNYDDIDIISPHGNITSELPGDEHCYVTDGNSNSNAQEAGLKGLQPIKEETPSDSTLSQSLSLKDPPMMSQIRRSLNKHPRSPPESAAVESTAASTAEHRVEPTFLASPDKVLGLSGPWSSTQLRARSDHLQTASNRSLRPNVLRYFSPDIAQRSVSYHAVMDRRADKDVT
ncbi:Putative heterokaryon incompatibility [Septoria linicola]|uniref:Heterokaryon incompatibility n=1 Tax=Septoria linicola TaxID=215465 RepID=A0A9Q9ELX2_9PEZI|nr:Putative heterokaryon incompatibility [Septoria linicola]